MTRRRRITNLEELLDRLADAPVDDGRVTFDAVLDVIGRRSFGPLLLVAGLITAAPVVGDVPGVPTIIGLFVLAIAGQLLFGRDHFWLPGWLLKLSVARRTFEKALGWMRKPARFVDRLLRQRLAMFTHGAGMYAMAVACAGIALAMPAMEVVPFSANGAGAAFAAFGLAMIAEDGLLALLAFLFTVTTFGLLLAYLL